MKVKKYQFEDLHYNYIEKLIKWYAKDNTSNSQKVNWLSDMMKKQFYNEIEKKYLNIMVRQYNDKT